MVDTLRKRYDLGQTNAQLRKLSEQQAIRIDELEDAVSAVSDA